MLSCMRGAPLVVRERPEVIRKWAEMEFFLGLPMVTVMGLSWAQPKHVDEGQCPLK